MSELLDIKSHAMTERVKERLLQYIVDKNLTVGTKLPNEYKLAEMFNVGRGTIREAVKLLVACGILMVKHGSGTYVASIKSTHDDPLGLNNIENKLQLALDLTDVRLILEPSICEMAAYNRTDEEAALLVKYCDDVKKKIVANEDYIKEDVIFHSHIAKCSHNMVVEQLGSIIDTAVLLIANITRKVLLDATVETHEQIVNCILNHDVMGAKTAMSMHLALNRNVILDEFQKKL